jgi:hypothetical protein
VNADSDSQILTIPEHADYIYLHQVDSSDAYYVRRVIEFRGVTQDGYYLVLDNLGQEQFLNRKPMKHMGFARAWQVEL